MRGDLGTDASVQGQYGMLGTSEPMEALYHGIAMVAKSEESALITGESGTGKELVARALHQNSSRKWRMYQPVNCAALSPALVVSELFGHVRGAFTGAQEQRTGLIEAANGGTLFLDEIGDLPARAQVSLLRFLENGEVLPLGAKRAIPVDVRIIAATNVDLEKAVDAGTFRADLFFRLDVLRMRVPRLKDCGSDVCLLANHFLRKACAEYGQSPRALSASSTGLIKSYPWPGNVRELINRVRRAVLFSECSEITPADLEIDRRLRPRQSLSLAEARRRADRDILIASLCSAQHNVSKAARELGVSRPTMYRLIKRCGIEIDELHSELRKKTQEESDPPALKGSELLNGPRKP